MTHVRSPAKNKSQLNTKVFMTTVLINQIFQFLTAKQLTTVSKVCKDWKKTASAEKLWQPFLKLDEFSLLKTEKFSISQHRSTQFFYAQCKTQFSNFKKAAIESFKRAVEENNFMASNIQELVLDFSNLPGQFFIAYSKNLIPNQLITVATADRRLNRFSVSYLQNFNLKRLKRVFERHALTFLEDSSLQQAPLQMILQNLAITTEDNKWVDRYEHVFDCVNLGKLIFSNEDNRKIFDKVPAHFVSEIDAKTFTAIILQIKEGEDVKEVLNRMCGHLPAQWLQQLGCTLL